MHSFFELTARFQHFRSLMGLAIFSRDGRFIDTSLPISDDLSEEIGSFFFSMAADYRDQGRANNVFSVAYGEKVFVYAEHAFGALLFMLESVEEIDEVMQVFTAHYSPIPAPTQALTQDKPVPGAASMAAAAGCRVR